MAAGSRILASMPPAAPLHYTLHGRGAPPVVLLHGLGSSSTDWPEQRAALQARYRVVAVDLPGHGRSPLPARGLTVESMAEDVAALLVRLDAAPATSSASRSGPASPCGWRWPLPGVCGR